MSSNSDKKDNPDSQNGNLINSNNENVKHNDGAMHKLKNFFLCQNKNNDIDESENINDETNIDVEIEKLKNLKLNRYLDEDALYRYLYLISNKKDGQVDMKLFDKLAKTVNVNYKSKYGDTALIEACKLSSTVNQTVEIVKTLLELKFKKHDVNNYGQSALHMAAAYDNVDLIQFLLKHGDGVDDSLLNCKTFGENQRPIHYAAKYGSYNAVRCLVNNYSVNKESKDYQDRTPLYLAAEYGNISIVKFLIEQRCQVDVKNIFGQKALYWIIAKCPEISLKVLDSYRECNQYTKKNFYYLKNLDLEPNKVEIEGEEKVEETIPYTKSILMYVVENQLLDVIVHPVIESLIKVKWDDFGKIRSYIDILFTLVILVVWNLIGVLVPYETRYLYIFPQDWWRIFLFVIGILGIIIVITIEIVELVNATKYENRANQQRKNELEDDKRYCHPLDKRQISYLNEETEMCKTINPISGYLKDYWNYYDMISIILLIAVVGTHIADVINHNEQIAKSHIRVFSVTVVIISIRVFQTGRVIYEKFGMLVVTLSFIIRKIIVWFCVYCIFWLPFASAFWMLFGYKRFSDATDEIGNQCLSVENDTNTDCEVIEISNYKTYNKVMFWNWMTTFGRSFDRDLMNEIDPIMSDILVGLYVGIVLLTLVNIFIAMLSSTFERVRHSAKAYFLLQRAVIILTIEHQLAKKRRIKHLKKLDKGYQENEGDTRSAKNSVDEENDPTYVEVNRFHNQIADLNVKIKKMQQDMEKSFKKIAENLSSSDEKAKKGKKKTNVNPVAQEQDESSKKVNKLREEINEFKLILLKKMNKTSVA